VDLIINTLGTNFNMNIIVFLPMVVLFYLNIKEAPEILSMIVGGALAILIAILVQKTSINDALSSLIMDIWVIQELK